MTEDLKALATEKAQRAKECVARLKALIEEDPQLNAMMPDPALADRFSAPDLPVERSIDLLLEAYAERPALGTRTYRIVEEGASGRQVREYLPAYRTVSYAEYRADIQAVAAAWTRGSGPARVGRDDYVCVIGFAGIEYSVIDTACLYVQAVAVPLQSTTSGVDIVEILGNVNPKAVAVTIDDAAVVAEYVVTHGDIPTLIVFDYEARDSNDLDKFKRAGDILQAAGSATRLISYSDLVAEGRGYPWEFPERHPAGSFDRVALVLHSSGSTGKPKGALMSEAALKASWDPGSDKLPSVTVAFAPLNHGMGRATVSTVLRRGSIAYFTLKPDMSTLFEDIRLARPTSLSFFPRVFELIYQHYQNEVVSRCQCGVEISVAREQIQREMRESFLGDRLLFGVIGAAPTPEVVKAFVAECFEIFLQEGYGNTEMGAGAVTRDNIIQRPNVIDYKLVDVPELNYYSTDKPYPRGEIRFKTQYQVKGYLNDPKATAELMDEDGYICSGDIVEERAPDYVVIIDRRKDVLKLSQGEYVAAGPLGTVFEAGSPLIRQVYVYGNSSRSYLLAVIVPDEEAAAALLGKDWTEAALRGRLREEMQRIAKENDLKSFEVPRDFIIEMEPFSQENGLLSSVRKRLRPALKARYEAQLEGLYEEHAARSRGEYEALKDSSCALDTRQKLTRLLEISLGNESLEHSAGKTFSELGGDSLAAVSLSLAIEDIFGVSLGADSLLSPTGCIDKWAGEIESLLDPSTSRPGMAAIHGENASELRSGDLSLERFYGAEALAGLRNSAPASAEERCVLVTGANGFLGRHVCLQWLERLAPIDGRVICIVRGPDNAAARQRLDEVFCGGDPALEAHYRELAEKHLEVLAGDAGERFLGLGEEVFMELAESVDRVVHVAALVNHRLAYEHLFGPNVLGTAEIIRLAATQHKKTLDFVSTEAVIRFVHVSQGTSNEDAPLLETVPLIDDRYAGGYAVSKWAGEQLARAAHAELGIPVNILRGPMMLAHRFYKEQINYTDTFTRLLYSIMLTGLAPSSFFAVDEAGAPQSESYDGIPVDIVAGAVVATADNRHEECRNFNVHNYHHGDGCTLDAFVDWIESAGYAVTRIKNYEEWLGRFEGKLKSLNAEQKQRSALDILGAYGAPQNGRGGIQADSENFQRLAQSFCADGAIPHLDEAFIHKCVDDIVRRYRL